MRAIRLFASIVGLLILAATPCSTATAQSIVEDEFPSVSKYQQREPISKIKAGDRLRKTTDDSCMDSTGLPNCVYVCDVLQQKVYDEHDQPTLICWYQQNGGGGYGCMQGSRCSSSVTCDSACIYEGCNLDGTSCVNC
jgi:hypothetical protein